MPPTDAQTKLGPLPDDESGISELRDSYRPERVRLLLVGESSPCSGKHFYLADSPLFCATREAFMEALGETKVPVGRDFLAFFRGAGCWLVDLADRPVNHLKRGSARRQRRKIVGAGVPRLSRTIHETNPELVVVIGKTFVERPANKAVREARYDLNRVWVLPFPRQEYRPAYVGGLSTVITSTLDAEAS